jgi:hypothetical protein
VKTMKRTITVVVILLASLGLFPDLAVAVFPSNIFNNFFRGAVTLSITTHNIMTLSIMILGI